MNKCYFTKDFVTFFENLKRNNDKVWFAENKESYEKYVLNPAKEFVNDMGKALKKYIPDISYSPKIDGSIFRLYKDARINKGKAPFKTHLGIIFWQGSSRLDSSSFYLHIEPPFYYTGVGVARFSPEILNSYKKALNNKNDLKILEEINTIVKNNYWSFNGDKLKNVPKNFTPLNSTAEFFSKFKSIYISDEMPINNDFFSDTFFQYVLDNYIKMIPFHKWLYKIIENA